MAARRKYIPRPLHVIIDHRTYRILWHEDESWDGDENHLGETRNVPGEIHLRISVEGQRFPDDQMRATLLHEIMHAVASTSMTWNAWDSLDKSHLQYDDFEELMVAGWSPGMLRMLKNNPEIVAYLLDDQEHE